MVKVWFNEECSKSRFLISSLESKNISKELVEYLNYFDKNDLKNMIFKFNGNKRDLIRLDDTEFDSLEAIDDMNYQDLVDFIVSNPNALQRPIVETNKISFIAREKTIIENWIKNEN